MPKIKNKPPKLRAWGKPSRKVMTMIIPSKKDKAKKRTRIKSDLRKALS
ncbi:MAG: hypothetical protein NTZ10_03595 [Candidatus Saganbacteria bacterium]|nr:hypothetical protein [Candidatus Saganbacteria bacterium]